MTRPRDPWGDRDPEPWGDQRRLPPELDPRRGQRPGGGRPAGPGGPPPGAAPTAAGHGGWDGRAGWVGTTA